MGIFVDGKLVGLYSHKPAFESGIFGNIIGLKHTVVETLHSSSVAGFRGIYGITGVCHQFSGVQGLSVMAASLPGSGFFSYVSTAIYGPYGWGPVYAAAREYGYDH
jgi:hypothetical protein